MSFFGGSSPPPPPPVVYNPPPPATDALELRVEAQERKIEEQRLALDEKISAQEDRAEAEKVKQGQQLSASRAVRRRSRRMLISQKRGSPETGILDAPAQTLGPGRKPQRKPSY